jgi:hypothetical protein
MSCVIVCPNGDETEQALASWAAIVQATVLDDLDVTVLRGPGLTAEDIAAAVEGAGAVLYFGHGQPGNWSDATGGVLLDGASVLPSAGASFGAAACFTAALLGQDVAERGAGWYVGFDERLPILATDPTHYLLSLLPVFEAIARRVEPDDAVNRAQQELWAAEVHYAEGPGVYDENAMIFQMMATVMRRSLRVRRAVRRPKTPVHVEL